MVSDRPKTTPRRLIENADSFLKAYNTHRIEDVHTPIPKPRPISTSTQTDSPPVPKPRNSLLNHKIKSSVEDLENGVKVMESDSNSIDIICSEKANIHHRSMNINNDNKSSLGIFPSGSSNIRFSIDMQNVRSKKGRNKLSNLPKIHSSSRKSKSKKAKFDNDSYFLPNCSIL